MTYDNPKERLRRIFGQADGPFSLFLNCEIMGMVESLYQEFGWDFNDHMVASVYSRDRVSEEHVSQIVTARDVVEPMCTVAVELMEELLAGGAHRMVTIAMDVTPLASYELISTRR